MGKILSGWIVFGLFYCAQLVSSSFPTIATPSLGDQFSMSRSPVNLFDRYTQSTPEMSMSFRSKTPIEVSEIGLAESPYSVMNLSTPLSRRINFVDKLRTEVDSSRIIIQSVILECDENNFPTKKALKNLFKWMYSKENLILEEKPSDDPSTKIFSVRFGIGPILFFLKINDGIDTLRRLAIIQEEFIKKMPYMSGDLHGSLLIHEAWYPIITKVEMLFLYKDPTGDERLIEVVQAAKGDSITNVFHEGKNFSIDIQNKKECLHAVGRALGLFQQNFMVYNIADEPESWLTVCHDDLHPDNVFYDQSAKQVYFIDNETMHDSCSISNDFNIFIFDNLFLYDCVKSSMSNYKIYLDLYREFIQGYFEFFSQDVILPLGLYIKKMTVEQFKGAHVFLGDAMYHCNYLHDVLDLNITKIMLSINSDAIKEYFDLTPLHLAVAGKSIKEVSELLSHDTELINTEDIDGHAPIFWAFALGRRDVLELLSKVSGLDINESIDVGGNTLLHYAVGIDDLETIALLLKVGAHVNAQNNKGQTALHIAVDNKNEAAITRLLQVPGINIDLEDKQNRKAYTGTIASHDSAFNNSLSKLLK